MVRFWIKTQPQNLAYYDIVNRFGDNIKITTLIWPCNRNVSQANSKATNGCSFEWQKAWRATQNLLVELCSRPSLVTFWNSTNKIAASCRRLECLEISTQAAAPATSTGQTSKGKYTELIQCFF